MSKQHAIHNEEACDYLLSHDKFNDWVVTTAFYSALHFVQNEIFPYKYKGKTLLRSASSKEKSKEIEVSRYYSFGEKRSWG